MNPHQKKKPKRIFLITIIIVAMLAVLFAITTLLKNKTQITHFDNQQFIVALKLRGTLENVEDIEDELFKQGVYEEVFEKNIAFYVYAQSLGYKITKSEIEQSYEQTIQFIYQTKESKISHKEMVKSAKLSLKEYERYLYKNTPYQVAQTKLEEHFMKQYPKIDRSIANQLARKHAIPYFRQHFAKEIKAFKEKQKLPLIDSNIGTGTKLLGRIITIEDNMFLVESNHENYWVPQDNIPSLNIGDLVEVYYKMRSNDTSPYVIDIWDLKIIDKFISENTENDTIQLIIPEGNKTKVKRFLGMLHWDKANFEMSRAPDYELKIDNITYQIWSYEDGFVLRSSSGKYRKLNESFTEELCEYLGLK